MAGYADVDGMGWLLGCTAGLPVGVVLCCMYLIRKKWHVSINCQGIVSAVENATVLWDKYVLLAM